MLPERVARFNTQPPKGGWAFASLLNTCRFRFNTQPPKGGWWWAKPKKDGSHKVSTHSRLKAAGPNSPLAFRRISDCFNTQPPKGGWGNALTLAPSANCFNTQPPKGGWHCGLVA